MQPTRFDVEVYSGEDWSILLRWAGRDLAIGTIAQAQVRDAMNVLKLTVDCSTLSLREIKLSIDRDDILAAGVGCYQWDVMVQESSQRSIYFIGNFRIKPARTVWQS
jgi:hypothetical protein